MGAAANYTGDGEQTLSNEYATIASEPTPAPAQVIITDIEWSLGLGSEC